MISRWDPIAAELADTEQAARLQFERTRRFKDRERAERERENTPRDQEPRAIRTGRGET